MPYQKLIKVAYTFLRPDLVKINAVERKGIFAVNRGGIVSAAKAYEGKKGQTCRRVYD